VNGDDPNNANDLSFVFDPNAAGTPANVAQAMRRVLDNPRNVGRAYLQENLGRVASRNGATNPFYGRVDLRLARRLPSLRGQSAELTFDVFNFDNVVNRQWGAIPVVPGANQALLSIAGFDRATRTYRYNVNERWGQTVKQGDPYQMQLGVRYGF
jgi:hypothetical protein